ncbi:hypothetical protein Y032_0378g306 [Ancylostoma ceylanicum]|uniref:Uncharacterized protein n=1 Tax=Ancylostoma ceylanicum TaxID=53326 RepID=A0A016RTM0_9BILA|nr:hypothetical protein Y032_0378g306 [Ancylostoma ceylanicum]
MVPLYFSCLTKALNAESSLNKELTKNESVKRNTGVNAFTLGNLDNTSGPAKGEYPDSGCNDRSIDGES